MLTAMGVLPMRPPLIFMRHPGSRPGGVRALSFGLGPADFVKLPVVQSMWNEGVSADYASLEVEEDYFSKAETAAKMMLKSNMTPKETDSLVPFVRDQFVSIHKMDTRLCNREVKDVAQERTLKAGAVMWGLAITVQKRSLARMGSFLYPWWGMGIVLVLLQWVFFVYTKALLITNARGLYMKKKAP
eukprot:CAMPEP_0119068208 /NCGR_PEP_ID=MMETSP1178-20130426/10600_1 /TAXON_ID=33656 /ORGANISM="unid sp, Strain CCMP2000" /LENGTH=186 /DNA_ID=CAMNT_0007049907 /DNA_START=40 /DNA_END=600 /DNA_ORIENTATION=-